MSKSEERKEGKNIIKNFGLPFGMDDSETAVNLFGCKTNRSMEETKKLKQELREAYLKDMGSSAQSYAIMRSIIDQQTEDREGCAGTDECLKECPFLDPNTDYHIELAERLNNITERKTREDKKCK